MRMNSLLAALAGCAMVPAIVCAQADVSTAFTYQGLLLDGGSRPTAIYDFEFRLFDSTATQQGPTITVGNKPIIDGLLTQDLNFGVQYQGRQMFLDIRMRPGSSVGAYTALTPRQELTATPYAQGLRLPYAGTVNSALPAVSLSNSGGLDLLLGGDMRLGSTVENGNLLMVNTASNPLATFFERSGTGGAGTFYTTSGSNYFRIEPDISGPTGGFFEFKNGNGGAAMQIDGDRTGGNPVIQFNGASSAAFDLTATGDSSVVLPADAINATEMLNEPGGVRIATDPGLAMNSTLQIIQQKTINCPTAGFVFAISSMDVDSTGHVAGTSDGCDFGISQSSTLLPNTQDILVLSSSQLPTGEYSFPTTCHNFVPVTAGPQTFYLLGRRFSGAASFAVYDATLTLIFIPTAYGTLSPISDGPGPDTAIAPPDATHPNQPTMPLNWTAVASQAEREQSIAANMARMQKELADLQKQLAELKAATNNNR